ncbi:endolytic transglycosylase MltG [Litoreibacter roseus]|uniref:Endolytic murein transglycosylase n=1 Tax=Litoreibacter roseus TaxID=2601869 RepID=A0A6N6JKZ1_9RHOB|nr:endolytic transglycosylase MltG [Litoreibacter roseus]GFE66715.1 branched-chain alpha-keto acid dehydrogenase subunit E2 [Litoreibacter roseus]
MWKSIASNALSVFIVLLVGLGIAVGWGQSQYTSEGPLETATFFEVPRGASLRVVSQRLEATGAITSPMLFRIGAEYADTASDLKFGSYELPAGASMAEIMDILTAGGPSTFRYVVNYIIRNSGAETRFRERTPGTGEETILAAFAAGEDVPEAYSEAIAAEVPIVYRVSVAEGLSSWQIVEGLKNAEFLTGELIGVPAEGSLAPDTYEVARGTNRGEILQRMEAAQKSILAEAWAARDPEVPLETPEEALILASIVEKETGMPEERGQVASVFTNRLRQGMKLQTDPTVIYGITKGESNGLGRGLRRSELRTRTPYNTYVIPALPPTPIANPGRASIEAALNPDETPYIFFVADGTGGHAFAETIGEHNENVARWREIEAQRNESQ